MFSNCIFSGKAESPINLAKTGEKIIMNNPGTEPNPAIKTHRAGDRRVKSPCYMSRILPLSFFFNTNSLI